MRLWRWICNRRAIEAALNEIAGIEHSYRAARLAREALGKLREKP